MGSSNSRKTGKNVNKNGDCRGLHPNSLSNLKPGKGRPKKDQSIIELIRSRLNETCEYDSNGRTWIEALVDAEMRMSLNDNTARKNMFDRLLGKAPEQIEIGNHEIVLRVTFDDYKRDSGTLTETSPETGTVR